jgi:glutathione synthase/RimK-type ligase-like ATP-grasp enzyme
MKILITTTKNRPPTAALFCKAAKELGLISNFWFPQELPLPQEKWDLLIPLNTALDYKDVDLDQLELYSKSREVKFLNFPAAIRKVRGKERQFHFFQENHIEHIPSLIIKEHPEAYTNQLEQLFKTSRGIVLKPFRGNGGRGVNLYEGLSSIFERLQEDFENGDQRWLLQPFVENTGEVRVLWHDGHPLISYSKRRDETKLINNLKTGARAKMIKLDDIPKQLLNYCKLIQSKTGLNFFAVDFLQTASNFICLEINTSPGLVYTSDLYQRKLAYEVLKHEVEK